MWFMWIRGIHTSLWGIEMVTVLGALLMSCSSPTPATSSAVVPTQTEVAMNSEQTLPISAQAVFKDRAIALEVAKTPQQQALGLMYRTTLAADRGMLFPFQPPQTVSFWMKNVRFPLDMIFLRNGVVQDIAASVPPCTNEPCSTYGPKVPIDQVIELRGGRAAELGLKVGDRVQLNFSNSKK
jgi:uncharacterized membrane protein (UPF0127 family)